ncbi:MAG: endonuclease III [Actinomycetota bacterium]|nr:endonuclease III [Actinomycetota bacterium]
MAKNYGKSYMLPYSFAIKNIAKIIDNLSKTYPGALTTSLNSKNPLQLLIATILAAQSTDKLVNKVTPALFEKYKNVKDFAEADLEELQEDIRSTGFYRNKSVAIINCCRDIIEKFKGKVPDSIDDLVKLHGVGRKTANVVLANAFNKEGIIVDTHMLRIANLIGLTINKDATKVEFDLQKIIPKGKWTDFSHKIVEHGRTICIARRPKCDICPINEFCRYYKDNLES